ncbi:MAG: VapC toxin family PIN domain ribonuclease, partial [Pseudomonadota bacterium]
MVIVALAADGDDGRRIRRRVVGERLLAPQLLDLEVGQAIRRFESAGRLTPQRATQAIGDLR